MAVALDCIVLARGWRKVLLTTALWWPMALACMVMARMQQTTLGATPPALWVRPVIALDALAFYLKQIVAPITLAIDYGRTPEIVVMKGWLWWTWLIPAAVAALLVWRPRRELIAAAIILVIGVSPVLGFTPFMFQFYSTVSDHYLYLAMLAPALALAWMLTRLPQRGMIAAAVGAIVVLGAMSVRQAGTWRDNESLYDRAIAVNPDSFLAYNNLASAYAHAGDVAGVAAQVAARVPDVPAAKAYRAQAKQDYHTALALLEKGIATRRNASGKDDYFKAHSNLASIHSILGHNEEALAHRRRAMEILLTYPPQARLEVPTGYCLIGQDLLKLGRAAEAAEAYETALRMEPDNRNAAEGRAKALRALASMQSEIQGD
jgi:tetratricopeptide (TPR) repeat protein